MLASLAPPTQKPRLGFGGDLGRDLMSYRPVVQLLSSRPQPSPPSSEQGQLGAASSQHYLVVLLAKVLTGLGAPQRKACRPKSSFSPFLGNLLKVALLSGPGFELGSSDLLVRVSSLPLMGPCSAQGKPKNVS